MPFHQGVLLPIPYLPSVAWFVKLWSNPRVCWDVDETIDKKRPRNRCVIATSHGLQTLSVPLAGGRNQRVKISNVKIANDGKWQRVHVHALQTAYGKSPYYVHYADELLFIISQPHDSLAGLNMLLIETMIRMFRLDVEVTESHEKVSTTIEDAAFDSLRYPQVFKSATGFIRGCSAVDLLFNCGPDSANVLKRAASL